MPCGQIGGAAAVDAYPQTLRVQDGDYGEQHPSQPDGPAVKIPGEHGATICLVRGPGNKADPD